MEKKPKYRVIYEELSDKIRNGTYSPGQRIMTEKEVSEQYEVSRITSKNALSMLEQAGLIVRKRGAGSYVADSVSLQAEVPEKKVSSEGKKITIGVLFDSFDYTFGCGILEGIEKICSERDIYMYFRRTNSDISLERKYINDFIDHGVDGIIVMCVHNDIYDERILRLTLDDFPVILLDRDMANVNIPCVATDNYAAAKDLAEKLIDRNHRYVSIISSEDENTSTIRNRIQGVQAALQERKILYDPALNITGIRSHLGKDMSADEQWEAAKRMIKDFMEEHPDITAYMAVQGPAGVMALEAAQSLGRTDDMEISFFDGPERSYYPKPYYARVIQNEELMGENAVLCLLKRIRGEQVEKNIVVPYQIVTK